MLVILLDSSAEAALRVLVMCFFLHTFTSMSPGRELRPMIMPLYTFTPPCEGPYPAVVDGDLCFRYAYDKEFIRTFTDAGIMLVMFARTELADDIRRQGRGNGPLYQTYPQYTFGALGAWAWGYSRCVDALEQLGVVDNRCIAFTGWTSVPPLSTLTRRAVADVAVIG